MFLLIQTLRPGLLWGALVPFSFFGFDGFNDLIFLKKCMARTSERTKTENDQRLLFLSVQKESILTTFPAFICIAKWGCGVFCLFFLSFILSLGDWLGGVLAGDPSSAAALSFWLTCASTSCVFFIFLAPGQQGRAGVCYQFSAASASAFRSLWFIFERRVSERARLARQEVGEAWGFIFFFLHKS